MSPKFHHSRTTRHPRPRSGRGQAPAGIQTKDVAPVSLAPPACAGDGKTEHANELKLPLPQAAEINTLLL